MQTKANGPAVSGEQVRRYRLAAHHLDRPLPPGSLTEAAGVCGVQNSPPGAFETALSDALEGACNMEVAQAVHERLRDQIVQHKESHDPEPLAVTAGEVGAILRSCSVPEEQVSCFLENCEEQFGKGAALDPMNLIDSGRFEVETSDAKISVDPERSYLVETRIIEGRAYLLIPAEGVTVNGLPVTTAHAGTAQPSDTLA